MSKATDSIQAEALAARIQGLVFPSLHDVSQKDIPPKEAIVGTDLLPLLYLGAYLLVGRAKIGKSWLLLQLILAIAEGGAFLGYDIPARDCEVLAIFAEDDNARIKERLAALGVATAPRNCHLINQVQLVALAEAFSDSCTFEEFLDKWLEAHPKVITVSIDTETTCRQIWNGERRRETSQRITESDYKQTRIFDQLALRRRLLILLVNHASKRKGGRQESFDLHELINRSGTAAAGCSGSIAMADPPGADPFDPSSKRRLFGIRARDLKDDVMLAICQQADIPLFIAEGPYRKVEQTEAEQEILQALEELEIPPGKFANAKVIAEVIGKNANTVKNIIGRMRRMKRITWRSYRINVKHGVGIRLDPM